jgi:CRP-like cAMP-binding protein
MWQELAMNGSGILGVFDSHDFLKTLSTQHRMVLASGARPFTKKPGEYLAKQGESANTFYLLQAGHVRLEARQGDQGKVGIHVAGPGEIVGWSWIVPPHRWQFDCLAEDDVQGLVFDAAWMRDKIDADHELGFHILRKLVTVIAARLAETRSHLADVLH